jgi:hypothetical protein
VGHSFLHTGSSHKMRESKHLYVVSRSHRLGKDNPCTYKSNRPIMTNSVICDRAHYFFRLHTGIPFRMALPLDQNELDKLHPYDIVCGRESVSYNNIGNRRFRIFISIHVKRYTEALGRRQKGHIIRSLVHILTNEIGAKFFRFSQGKLVELTESQVRQKVGHALRDMASFSAISTGKRKSPPTIDGEGQSVPDNVRAEPDSNRSGPDSVMSELDKRSSLVDMAHRQATAQSHRTTHVENIDRILMGLPFEFHDIGEPHDSQSNTYTQGAKLKSDSSPESINYAVAKGGLLDSAEDSMAPIDDSIFSLDHDHDDDRNQPFKEKYR